MMIKRTNPWRKPSATLAAATAAGIAGMGLFGSKPVQAQPVYGISDTGKFGILDLSSGSFSTLKTYDLVSGSGPTGGSLLTGLAFDSTNGNVFAVDDTSGLYQIDTNGQTYSLTSQGQYAFLENSGQTVRSIAFDKGTHTLYGLASDKNTGANASLYSLSLSPVTGTVSDATFVKNLGFSSFGGLAIINSTAYATQGNLAGAANNGPVYQFSLAAAGSATFLGGTAVAGFANPASALADLRGDLAVVDQGKSSPTLQNGATYNVNLATGTASQQAFYNLATTGRILAITDGLTPEPGTLGLLGMGLTMGAGSIAVRRQRKNKVA